jgi:hypothetical protein
MTPGLTDRPYQFAPDLLGKCFVLANIEPIQIAICGIGFEEAMQIITDGSGKHFDPLIVDAFVSAGDEVHKVEAEFSRRTNEAGWLEKSR